MKKFLQMTSVALVLLTLCWLHWDEKNQMTKENMVILNPNQGELFAGGAVFVHKNRRVIVARTPITQTILWEKNDGKVVAQFHMAAVHSYVSGNLPATKEQLALFRKYFPAS